MVRALSGFNEDAIQQLDTADAQRALILWGQGAGGENGGLDRELFAAEAGFAAAARLAVEARMDGPAVIARAFPHLTSSPLFSWYRPSDELAEALSDAFGGELGGSPTEPLGWLYQFVIPEDVRKRFGQFYTSPAIVSSMLDGVGYSGPAILDKRLIDPACGAGAYLIESTCRLIAAAEDEGLSGVDVYRVVQQAIHGLDLNPLGVLLTEAAIGLLLAPHLHRCAADEQLEPLHLYITDSLRAGELAAEAESDVAEQIKTRAGVYSDGFDYVVANPPYAKFPSRLMTDEQKRRFSETTYGHPNLYGLFLQVGVELLADGGRLAFINPKSFVSGLYFRNLRRFLDRHLDLEGFDTFDRRTGLFEGVLQDVVILTATKTAQRSKQIQLREFSGPPDGKPQRTIAAPRESVLLDESFDYAYFVTADELAHRALAKMTADSQPLARLGYEAVTGTIVWNRLKEHQRNEPTPDALPLIWGNGVRLFRFLRMGNRARQATHMALVKKTESIVSRGDALLVKRMTAKEEARRIVACRVPDPLAHSPAGYFAENHVNIVRPTEDAQIELDAVLGLLNSRLYDYVFRSLNGNTQVSATELELLPVRVAPELAEIAAAARRLTASGAVDGEALVELDQLVFRLYGLDDEEIGALDAAYGWVAAAS